ncbi:MAG: App1 family protein, partial [Bacteroidota bacterium]
IIRPFTFPFRYLFAIIKKKIGKLDTIKIEALYAFGSEQKIFFKGRVVESYKQSKPSARKTYLQNLLAALRRYAGSSIPEAKVRVIYKDQEKTLESDADGIVECSFEGNHIKNETEDKLCFSLVAEEGLKPERERAYTIVIRYPSDHPMGIISDIDDTILISHATRTGKKIWLSVSKNAYTRRPFPGVSSFYKALVRNGENPVFYVSSSDWNLFDMIRDFLNYRKIPPGPLLLKDLHVNLKNIWKSGGGSHQHKLEKIRMLLKLYQGMQFVLIGDSGQHDPELYATIIKENPGRIKAVYIREVRPITKQRRELLAAKIKDPESPDVTFVATTEEAIEHAKNHNLIE